MIGVGRTRPDDCALVESCIRVLETLHFSAAVFSVDVRRREDVLLLIETLLAMLETRRPELEHESA